MEIPRNKLLVRRFVQEVFEELRPDAVDVLVADGFVSHSWPSTGEGKSDLKAATQRMADALTDVRFTIEDMIAEEDRVCVRLTASAKQVGELMGMPPSGRSYKIGEIHIFRLWDGRIVEHWDELDAMGMMKQLTGDSTGRPG
jgi:steroid delta-isomerase-like uncharacterized protein